MAVLVLLAVAFSCGLLIKDMGMDLIPRLPEGLLSAAPLLLVAIAFLILQTMTRPVLKELLKNLLLAATFILWGIVQLLPQNTLSTRLGNLVVALFVLDLAWAVLLGMASSQSSLPPKESSANHPEISLFARR
jgi:hypothetical protein